MCLTPHMASPTSPVKVCWLAAIAGVDTRLVQLVTVAIMIAAVTIERSQIPFIPNCPPDHFSLKPNAAPEAKLRKPAGQVYQGILISQMPVWLQKLLLLWEQPAKEKRR